jgi:hypothetical protein
MAKHLDRVPHAADAALVTCAFSEFSARASPAEGADSGVICTVCTSTFWDRDHLRECGPSEQSAVPVSR